MPNHPEAMESSDSDSSESSVQSQKISYKRQAEKAGEREALIKQMLVEEKQARAKDKAEFKAEIDSLREMFRESMDDLREQLKTALAAHKAPATPPAPARKDFPALPCKPGSSRNAAAKTGAIKKTPAIPAAKIPASTSASANDMEVDQGPSNKRKKIVGSDSEDDAPPAKTQNATAARTGATKPKTPPPIVVRSPGQWSSVSRKLRDNRVNFTSAKTIRDSVAIKVQSPQEHKEMT